VPVHVIVSVEFLLMARRFTGFVYFDPLGRARSPRVLFLDPIVTSSPLGSFFSL